MRDTNGMPRSLFGEKGVNGKLSDKNEFAASDVMRFVMAVLVVSIHTNPFQRITDELISNIIQGIWDLTVPFFFLLSGFFFYQNQTQQDHLCVKESQAQRTKEDSYAKRYIGKLLKWYLLITVLTLPISIVQYVLDKEGLLHCMFSIVKYVLFVGKLYQAHHLWYVLSLIYSILLLHLLRRLGVREWVLYGVALVIYGAYVLFFAVQSGELTCGWLMQFNRLYEAVFNQGAIFQGPLYVSLGMLLASKGRRISPKIGMAVCVLLEGIYLLSAPVVGKLVLPVVAYVFVMTILSIKGKPTETKKTLRNVSSYVYFTHLIFAGIVSKLFTGQFQSYGVIVFTATLALSVGSYFVVHVYQSRRM